MVKKIVLAFSLFSLLINPLIITASANSAQSWWRGTDASGVIITDGSCPVIVKNEVLTFNIGAFPQTYYSNAQDMENYGASVTAQYTFYNPSDMDVTARLLFPFGEKPMYFDDYYDNEKNEYVSFDDTAKYEILADGIPTEKKLRYTLNTGKFDVSDALSKIKDEFTEDYFYYPEMPVIKYTFTVSGIDTEKYNASTAGFDIDITDNEARYYFVDQSGFHSQGGNIGRLSNRVENGDNITVYVIGNTARPFPEWHFYKDGGAEDREKIDGRMTVTSKEEMTFYELVFSGFDENSGIPEADWYNATVTSLNNEGYMSGAQMALDIEDKLLRWYEYEITVPAKAELINTVNAPLYPEIDSSYSPAVFDYTYLLSPAKTWREFGKLDIIINTPHFLTESEFFSFEATDKGYRLSLEGLPDNELSFRLSSSEFPERPQKHLRDIIPVEIIISFSVITAVIVLIITLTAVLIKLKKRKI